MKTVLTIIKKLVILALIVFLGLIGTFIFRNFDIFTERYGIIDRNENEIVPFEYGDIYGHIDEEDHIKAYKRNIFGVLIEKYYLDHQGNKYLFASRKDNWTESIPNYFLNRASICDENLKWKYIDWDGNSKSKFYDYIDDNYTLDGIATVGEKKRRSIIIWNNRFKRK